MIGAKQHEAPIHLPGCSLGLDQDVDRELPRPGAHGREADVSGRVAIAVLRDAGRASTGGLLEGVHERVRLSLPLDSLRVIHDVVQVVVYVHDEDCNSSLEARARRQEDKRTETDGGRGVEEKQWCRIDRWRVQQ